MLRVLLLVFAFVTSGAAFAGKDDVAIVVVNATGEAQRDSEGDLKSILTTLTTRHQIPPHKVIIFKSPTKAELEAWVDVGGNGLLQQYLSPTSNVLFYYSGGLEAVGSSEGSGRGLLSLKLSDGVSAVSVQRVVSSIEASLRSATFGSVVLLLESAKPAEDPSLFRSLATKRTSVVLASGVQSAYYRTNDIGVFTSALASVPQMKGEVSFLRRVVGGSFVAESVVNRTSGLQKPMILEEEPEVPGKPAATMSAGNDDELAAWEETMCRILPTSNEQFLIRRYLTECKKCTCRPALENKAVSIDSNSETCKFEAHIFDTLIERRASADEFKNLAENSKCPDVQAAAMRRAEVPRGNKRIEDGEAACGHFVVAYCTKHETEAIARSKRLNFRVIDTNDRVRFPGMAPGWFCAVNGPFAQHQAEIERMSLMQEHPTAYVKKNCK